MTPTIEIPPAARGRLRQLIADTYSLAELRTLTYDLDVPYEELPGDTLSRKAQGVIEYLDNRGRLPALIDALEQERPHVRWQDLLPAEPEAAPPFPGLRPFGLEDEALFFGRERLTAGLVEHLQTNPFLAVIGPSGSGKSSLVRAGLLPALRRGGLTWQGRPSDGWEIDLITPGSEPLKALAGALTRGSGSVAAMKALLRDLQADGGSLDLFLYQKFAGRDDDRLVLIVDQFEELFTRCEDPAERRAFVDNLLQALDGRLTLVLTLRADFYGEALRFEGLRPRLERGQKTVGAMTPAELRRAIEGPAAAGSWTFQSGLVETILQEMGSEPGALPLLAHALRETWQRREGRQMTLAGYRAAGGVEAAIATTAEALFADLDPADQARVRAVFLQLTAVGEGVPDTRRRAARAELARAGEAAEAIEPLLHRLAAARLVVMEDGVVEVAHEALIREWPRLQEWLAEARESLYQQRRLREAAQTWLVLNRDPGALWRGLRLAQAEAFAAASDVPLSALEAEFLQAGREALAAEARERAAERQKLRRAALLAMVAGGLAFPFFYVLAYAAPDANPLLLRLQVLLRMLPGGVAALLLIVLVDMSRAVFAERPLWTGRIAGAAAGAAAFSFLLGYHAVLGVSSAGAMSLAAVQGALWGLGAG